MPMASYNLHTSLVEQGMDVEGFGMQLEWQWTTRDICILETIHCIIQKLTLRGQFISQFGSEGTAEGQFKIPTGLLFSQSQLLFVCNSENHRIQVFLNEPFSYTFGKFGKLPSYFNSPNDLALNSDEDQLFVTDK